MGLDVWFRDDVARMLAAAYHQGFEDALRAMAVAFGLLRPGATSLGDPSYLEKEIVARLARKC